MTQQVGLPADGGDMMIGCGLSAKTAHMDDGEFWAFVFPQNEGDDYEPEIDDAPDMATQSCIQCGEGITVADWEEACKRQDESFCDGCADARLPNVEVTR